MPLDPNDPLTPPGYAPPAPVDTDQVASIEVDDVDPSWARVYFADGREEVRPTAEAQALPKVPQAPPNPGAMTPGGQFDPLAGNPLTLEGATPLPPPAPVGPGNPPSPDQVLSAGQPGAAPSSEASLVAGVQSAANGPGAGFQDLGVSVNTAGGPGTLPPAQHDPGAAIVAPGGVGAPGATRTETGVQGTEYAVDPAQAGKAAQDAYGTIATQLGEADANKLAADRAENASLLKSNEAAQAAYNAQVRKAEIFTEESAKALKAVEDHPVEEDFFKDAPGRQAAAWIALALSGFLQGATKGANPALNQMMQSLNGAQERFIANQRADKNSKLQLRREALGDAKAAESSVRMQLPALMEKYANLQARQTGLNELTPGLSTAMASMKVKGVEAGQHFASLPVQRTEARMTEETKAAQATPTFQIDRDLAAVGVDRKAHADAMDPKGANLGGMVQGAERLAQIQKELQTIAARHGGDLPNQNTISYSSVGLAGQAARMGSDSAKDQVRAKQLIEEAKLAFKQTLNIKSVDSENEGKNFNAMIDSGETATTLRALAEKAAETNQRAISTASGYAGDAQGYLNLIRRTMTSNPGVTSTDAPKPKRSTGFRVDAPKATEASTLQANAPAGGGPAPSPLAPSPPGAKAPEGTPATGSQRGTYRRLRESKPDEPR